jgi:hypothetical protein
MIPLPLDLKCSGHRIEAREWKDTKTGKIVPFISLSFLCYTEDENGVCPVLVTERVPTGKTVAEVRSEIAGRKINGSIRVLVNSMTNEAGFTKITAMSGEVKALK